MRRSLIAVFCVALAAACLGGCSLKKFAIRKVGDALASGPSVYETDEDVELVGQALPFSLKLVESLLAETPRHRGLLITACRGFTLYSYAYVDFEAGKVIEDDLARGRGMLARARKLYLRAFGYGIRAIETAYPGFGESLRRNPAEAVAVFKLKRAGRDVELIYWSAASLGLAIAASKGDAVMLARIPEVEALIERAIELDADWDDGTLYEFQVSFAGAKPGGVDLARLKGYYERALALSEGKRAGLHLAYAEAAAVPENDYRMFRELIEKALAVDPLASPRHRLVNALARRRAEWLSAREDDLFLILEESSAPEDDKP